MLTSEVLTRALRLLRVYELGETPDGPEMNDALDVFNGMCLNLFGRVIGRPLKVRAIDSATTVCGPFNYLASASLTLTTPEEPCAGYRFGVSNAPLSGAVVTIVGGGDVVVETPDDPAAPRTFFFRPDFGWKCEQAVGLSDEPLLEPDLHQALVWMLVFELQTYHRDKELTALDLRRVAEARTQVRSRYLQQVNIGVDPALQRRSRQAHDTGCTGFGDCP